MPRSQASLHGKERLDRLRLIRSENVGPATFRHLVERFGSAAAAIEALPRLAARGGRAAPLRVISAGEAEREMATVERLGGRLVFQGEADYPPLLGRIEDAPPVVAVRGDAALLRRPCIAIVGARNCSINGKRIAEGIARDLGAAGFIVVSGLARGIDTAAHGGALETGTVAVMPGGMDVVYPPENEDLLAAIAGRGAVVCEAPPGARPVARSFHRRNRIISGLSRGVLVVEAAHKSGSMITARWAADQGREVMAVPGSPLDPRAQGTNDLIRHGAALVESAADVIAAAGPADRGEIAELRSAALAPSPGPAGTDDAPGLDGASAEREKILSALGPTPTPVDEIVRGCHVSPSLAGAILLELELAGRVQRHPGGRVSLMPVGLAEEAAPPLD
ncbi:MAG: DNA-protecting protein DprA [Alphaproteobacteria bacterium]|nr:DNA-protecting protein DprA [Alphaproteobacteria bacterium]